MATVEIAQVWLAQRSWLESVALTAAAVAVLMAVMVRALLGATDYWAPGRHRPDGQSWNMAERRGAHWTPPNGQPSMERWPGSRPLPAVGPRVEVRRGK